MIRDTQAAGQKIAVVGGGVAGIVSAYLLQQRHRVTLFEQNDYLGGHTRTIEIDRGQDAGLAVDTGFIVLNDQTYPLFQAFLARLGVGTRDSEMSFGFQCRQTGLVYAGTDLKGLFAQRRNLVRPTFYRFLLEIARFSKQAREDLSRGTVPPVSLREYLARGRYSSLLIDNYLVPMTAAIWSTPALQTTNFPAASFLHFFRNHGLLSFRNRPVWKTVVGGSHSYVKAFLKSFRGELLLNCCVRAIERTSEQVTVQSADGEVRNFDQVVIATHADQALQMLQDPCHNEQRLLSPWRYQKNYTVLHTDTNFLPKQRSAWAAWNFTRLKGDDDRPVFVTYYMNRLQGLEASQDYCVTLNCPDRIDPAAVIATMDYHHPLYSQASMATQPELPKLNGTRRTSYCGSYFGYGFHEDAVRSAVAVAARFGISL